MSRPHDGQRTFFPFGNPFRIILPKGSYLSPKLLALLNIFEQTLAESLKRLKPKNASDVLSLSWMSHAMESLSEAHANIKTLITDLQFPVSDWDEKWIDIYLDCSVKLLDICIVFSSELSRLDQGQLLLRYVLHVLDSSSSCPSSEQLKQADACLHDWVKQLNLKSPKFENCSSILQSLSQTLDFTKVKNSAKGKVLMTALNGVKVMTIFICSVFTAALSGCFTPLMDMNVSDKFLWAEAFSDLQAVVNEEVRSQFSSGKITMLKELEAVEKCVDRLHALTSVSHNYETLLQSGCKKEEKLLQSDGIRHQEVGTLVKSVDPEESEGFQESVSNMAEEAERFGNGLDLLAKQVRDFFQIVLTGRDALLSNLRGSDVTRESSVDEIRP
ncbi:protein BPS1, chloroplastic [Cocos nucifera]|uniref:Protein BPS1, chloroplastic n=1 Tax=Cocos nucifera TaxID=13894 RepID=A0A8K0N8T5_COCNU|nr:protein BPS1, chloroplastic [Cocos nucifera]